MRTPLLAHGDAIASSGARREMIALAAWLVGPVAATALAGLVVADHDRWAARLIVHAAALIVLAGVGALLCFIPRWRRLGAMILCAAVVGAAVGVLRYGTYPAIHPPPARAHQDVWAAFGLGIDHEIGRLVSAVKFSVVGLLLGWLPAWLRLRRSPPSLPGPGEIRS
jgi:hypothetical protein